MFRFIMLLILVGVAVALFFLFTKPLYMNASAIPSAAADLLKLSRPEASIKDLLVESSDFEGNLNRSQELVKIFEDKQDKFNKFKKNEIEKLDEFLPTKKNEVVDNIELVLELQRIGGRYGFVIQNPAFKIGAEKMEEGSGIQAEEESLAGRRAVRATAVEAGKLPYNVFNVSFSTEGSYDNFIRFLEGLEWNLRMIDVNSVKFSSKSADEKFLAKGKTSSDNYKYDFSISTYWMPQ